MQHFLMFIIPGAHLHMQKKWLLGDGINLLASLCIISGTYLLYFNQPKESFYPFAVLLLILIFNSWRIRQIDEKTTNPAFIKLQEIEFKEIIISFLMGNNEATKKNLKKVTNQTPCPHELEIFLLHLYQNQGNKKEAKKIKAYLQKQPLSTTARSLFYSISKKHPI